MKKNSCFGTLYKYELLKILRNKVTVVTFLIFFVFSFIQGEFEVRGNIDLETLAEYQTINYRPVDDELLAEWDAATNEYGEVIDEKDIAYDSMEEWIKDIVGYHVVLDDVTEEVIYEKRLETIDEAYTESYLTQEEIDYWKAREEDVKKPFVWHDLYVAFGLENGICNTMLMMLFVVGLGLASVFSVESQRKTDPMIRSSINGEKELYFAKILAGMSFCLFSAAVFLGGFITYVGVAYGFTGLDIPVQIEYPFTQLNMTMGQSIAVLLILTVCGSVFISALAMFVSEVLRNSLASMGVLLGGYFVIFALGTNIPMKMKTLSKWISLFPAIQITPRFVYEFRLFKFAGHYFSSFKVAPVVYLATSLIMIVFGYCLYRKYEIKSN